jgi:hypothetical protein
MDHHADPYRSDKLGPRLLEECSLRVQCGGDGIRRGREGGLHRITDSLEVDAVVGLNRGIEQGKVALKGLHHRVLVAFPARSCLQCR